MFDGWMPGRSHPRDRETPKPAPLGSPIRASHPSIHPPHHLSFSTAPPIFCPLPSTVSSVSPPDPQSTASSHPAPIRPHDRYALVFPALSNSLQPLPRTLAVRCSPSSPCAARNQVPLSSSLTVHISAASLLTTRHPRLRFPPSLSLYNSTIHCPLIRLPPSHYPPQTSATKRHQPNASPADVFPLRFKTPGIHHRSSCLTISKPPPPPNPLLSVLHIPSILFAGRTSLSCSPL